MTIESDLVSALTSDGTVSGIVGTDVYLGHVETSAFPMVQIRATGGEVQSHLTGEGALKNEIYQIDCYSQKASEAAALARACRAALTGEQSGFTGVALEAGVSLYDEEFKVERSAFECRSGSTERF